MGILTKDPVMAKRNKTWNHWTLALVVLTLYMVQPSSTSATKTWGQACTFTDAGTAASDCAAGEGVCVKADGTAATTNGQAGTCGCETDQVLNFATTKACVDQCVTATCTSNNGVCVWGPKGDGQICISSGSDCAETQAKAAGCDATKPFCVLTDATTGACQKCKTGWKCPTANHTCDATAGNCVAPKACTETSECSSQPGGRKVCLTKGSKMFCGKGCGDAGCKGTTPICVATNLDTAGTCMACNTTLKCPTGKTCVDKKCVVATTPLTSNTTVASPSDTTNTTKNTDNTVDTNDDNLMSTTANNTNSAPGMPSAAGSLILLTCAAALVLAAA